MKKDQFLNSLRGHLAALPGSEVNDIIRDQEEYLQDAMSAGRSEEEAVASLGDPKLFASNLTAEMKIKAADQPSSLGKQVSSTFSAVLAILALTPLNLIFVFGPFLAICGVLVAGWAGSFGIFVGAWAVMIAFLFKLAFLSVGVWTQLSTFFFTVGCIGSSLLAISVMAIITRLFFKGTLAYLKWNINFIQGRRA